jgi:predicted acetyltransferase
MFGLKIHEDTGVARMMLSFGNMARMAIRIAGGSKMTVPKYNAQLEVRVARPDEKDAAGRVGSKAFRMYALDSYDPANTLVGVTPEGKLVSALSLSVAPLWWGGAKVPAAAVGGVATDPSEQRKGYAGGLMVGAVHHMRERKWWVCPLWPFSYAYYRKYGWELPARDLLVHLWPDMVRRIGPISQSVRPAHRRDVAGMAGTYRRAARKTNCQTVRSMEWWNEHAKPEFLSKCLVYASRSGKVDGYLVYRSESRNMAQGAHVDVVEVQAVDLAVQKALVRSIAEIAHAASITLLLPNHSLLPFVFPERVRVEMPERLMVRVTDPAKALECLRPPRALEGKISFEIRDWIVREDRPLSLTAEISDGRVAVVHKARRDALRCTINGFSRLFCGGQHTAQARALGLVEGGNPGMDSLCDNLLGARVPFRSGLEPG